MDLLVAVNGILPVLGEHPVTSLTVKHPTLAVLVPLIASRIRTVSTTGLWFNTSDTTLYPDSEGLIAMPSNTLSFLPDTAPVVGRLAVLLPFEELPESAAAYVWYTALVDMYVTDIGMESNVRHWEERAAEAALMFQREHLRAVKYTTRRSPRYQRILSAMRG